MPHNDQHNEAPEESVIERLDDIMDDLPDSCDYAGAERRKYSLTKGDVMLIYRIARIASISHDCPFKDDEPQVLRDVAVSITKTRKIAFTILITGIVTATLAGVWSSLKHVFLEWVKVGAK